jgi:hypothetical protein
MLIEIWVDSGLCAQRSHSKLLTYLYPESDQDGYGCENYVQYLRQVIMFH